MSKIVIGIIMGAIAAVVAGNKGHKTFATVVGIWSALAAVLSIVSVATGMTTYVIAPGGLLLIIAICMSDLNKSSIPVDEIVLCCPKCGRIVSSFGAKKYTCSKCGHDTEMMDIHISAKDWIAKDTSEKKEILKSSGLVGIIFTDLVQDKSKETESTQKKFQCQNCNKKLTGWYDTCPNCGQKGSIIKCEIGRPIDMGIQPEPAKTILPASNQGNDSILYCRNCGKRLEHDSLFCSYCGVKI